MDIEAGNRAIVRNALSNHFDIWEEIDATTQKGNIRIDVVAVPKAQEWKDFILAFEVKKRDEEMSFTKFSKQCKQASDSVGSTLQHRDLQGKTVAAAFVFPSPTYRPTANSAGFVREDELGFRADQYLQYAGVLHLALQFRVGHARFMVWKKSRVFHLSMGPNPIWNETQEWFRDGKNLVNSFRIGSRVQSAGR